MIVEHNIIRLLIPALECVYVITKLLVLAQSYPGQELWYVEDIKILKLLFRIN